MTITKITFSKLVILSLIAAFFWLIFPVTDADLGWHLRYGDYFWQHLHLLTANTFSWAFPQFLWANHSWGYDLIASLIFQHSHFFGLSLFGATLLTLSLYLALVKSKTPHLSVWLIFIWVFINQNLLNTGVKSSFLSLLFTVCLFRLIASLQSSFHFSIALKIILIFFFWVNLHGQFFVGLCLLYLFTGFYLLKSKPFRYSWLATSLVASLACLANPWGSRLFSLSIAHLHSPALKTIYEWMPWELNQPLMLFYLAFTLLSVIYLMKLTQLDLPWKVSIILFGILSLESRRFIPLNLSLIIFLLSSQPFPTRLPLSLVSKTFILKPAFILIVLGLIGYRFIYSLPQIYLQSWNSYCHSYLLCSEGLVDYLKLHPLTGHLFNSYRLGGHLIYRLPHTPVYIDGRMTIWTDGSDSPYLTYLNVIHAKPGSLSWLYSQNIQAVATQPQFEISQTLKEANWPIVYHDHHVVLFTSPLFPPL